MGICDKVWHKICLYFTNYKKGEKMKKLFFIIANLFISYRYKNQFDSHLGGLSR
ncbi:hypothetical protein K709_0711 [Campylobacter coli HN-CCD07046]|nr:hypothetical protein K709_0711 [Campylobacter coli HN-CCD07046]